jgi:hypothetical protein
MTLSEGDAYTTRCVHDVTMSPYECMLVHAVRKR